MKSFLIILVALMPVSFFFSISAPISNINKEFDFITASDFDGLWVNENEETRGTTQCKIRYENNRFMVQMWGACYPDDCDWGENTSKEVDEGVKKFELLWEQKHAERSITYELVDGKLRLNKRTHYRDNSGREDYTLIEYFIKQ
jgi:hypothetical protein